MEKTKQKPKTQRRFVSLIADHSAVFALIILFIIAVLLKGDVFLTTNNMVNILMNNSFIGIIALGMTLIIITGNIDLSVGSQLAATGLVTLAVFNQTSSVILGIGAGILTGIVTGALTGFIVSAFAIPSFIVTLGTMQIYRSVAQYFFNGGGVRTTTDNAEILTNISNTRLFGEIPLPIIYWLLLSLVVAIFMRQTSFGRHIYAVGSNERATFLSGIDIHRIKIGVFAISGALIAIASILEASRLGSMNSASSGRSYEMDAIAAVVIGGTAMNGGRGTIMGTVFGTLTLGIINNLMNLLGVPTFLVGAIKGFIIIGAVMLQRTVRRAEDN